MKSTYTNKVFAITDLTKYIGCFKHQFELASDIEKLNNQFSFQSLVYHLFRYQTDTGLIIRNNNQRLMIKICKCKNDIILLTFQTFEKFKRLPYYFDTLFLYKENTPLDNQNKLANHILNDTMLLPFFQCTNKKNVICSHY